MSFLSSYYAQSPFFTVAVVLVAGLLLMYLLRLPAQRFIEQFFRLLQKQFRLLAKSCLRSEQRLRLRHYEVTKALVELLAQRQVEKSYKNIEQAVLTELNDYEKRSKQVAFQLEALQEDYQKSAYQPPPLPEWVEAVDAIAKLEREERNSDVMIKILQAMHETIQQHQQDAMREHRWNVSCRHKVLAALEPQWKKLGAMVAKTEKKNDQLQQKLHRFEQEMSRYELLTAGNGQGFMASVLARFSLAALLLVLTITVGAYNAELLLSAMQQHLTVDTSDLSYSVIIMHTTMLLLSAVLLFESLSFTHMLPLMVAASAVVRRGLALVSGIALIFLSILSASWVADVKSLVQLQQATMSDWTLLSMSFMACWVFALTAIPLEYFLQTARPVLSNCLQLLLYVLSLSFRHAATLTIDLGRLVMRCYDLVIFLPLWLESFLKVVPERRDQDSAAMSSVEPTAMTFNDEEIDASNVTKLDFSVHHK